MEGINHSSPSCTKHKVQDIELSPQAEKIIVKIFMASGKLSLRKGQGQKQLLNPHDHPGLTFKT